MQKTSKISKKRISTNSLVKISVLSVMAYILMVMDFAIPIFPVFLKLDFSDIPALLGAFAIGPLAGVAIELVKVILHFITKTSTGGVGELANFIVGAAYVAPAAFIYHRKKDKKHALLGMLAGTIAMTLVGVAVNMYITLPFYSKFMIPMDDIIAMGTIVNSRIVDLKTLVLYGITPFNILKGTFISVITLLIYKKVSPILKDN